MDDSHADPIDCRIATPADLEAICVLGQHINALHHAQMPTLFAPPSESSRDRSHWAQSIDTATAETFVVRAGECIVGFVTVALVEESSTLMQAIRYARVGSIGIVASHRGRGIGRELMRHAEDWAIAREASEVRLSVAAFNRRASHLYEELGYTVRFHAMSKSLASPESEPGDPTR